MKIYKIAIVDNYANPPQHDPSDPSSPKDIIKLNSFFSYGGFNYTHAIVKETGEQEIIIFKEHESGDADLVFSETLPEALTLEGLQNDADEFYYFSKEETNAVGDVLKDALHKEIYPYNHPVLNQLFDIDGFDDPEQYDDPDDDPHDSPLDDLDPFEY